MSKHLQILGISGSLRSSSSATAVLNHVAHNLPDGVQLTIYSELGDLPHFNDSDVVPEKVSEFKRQISEADGVMICTPEYAFGVPGSLKNALDWTVSTGELVGKPVALITAASVGHHAHEAFLLTFKALSAKMTEQTALLVPFIRAKLNAKGEIADPDVKASIRTLLDAFVQLLRQKS